GDRDLQEERAEHPHRDRQVHRGVEHHQGPHVVQQGQLGGGDVDRHHHRHHRQHLGGDEEEQHVLGALDRVHRQGVGGGQAEQQHQQRGDQGGGQRVAQVGQEVCAEHRGEPVQGGLEEQRGRVGGRLVLLLEGGEQ